MRLYTLGIFVLSEMLLTHTLNFSSISLSLWFTNNGVNASIFKHRTPMLIV